VSCGGGAIIAKATSTAQVRLSSFTAELDGLVNVIKSGLLLDNILKEMGITVEDVQLWTDNEALSDFVNGDRVAKAVRSMELRMWSAQEHVKMGNVQVNFMRGKEMPSDKLIKITSVKELDILSWVPSCYMKICQLWSTTKKQETTAQLRTKRRQTKIAFLNVNISISLVVIFRGVLEARKRKKKKFMEKEISKTTK
jgi:hypothetical protein